MLQRVHRPQKLIHIDPRARLKYAIQMGTLHLKRLAMGLSLSNLVIIFRVQ